MAVFEAALWIGAEHDSSFSPPHIHEDMDRLHRQINARLPVLPVTELAQPLLRELSSLGFQQDEWNPPRPESALLHKIVQRRRGQPLGLALVAMELARRLDIPMEGEFSGPFPLARARRRSCTGPLQRPAPVPQGLP